MFDRLIEILKANPRKIVFTEGPDARILEAADRLKKDGFLTPILIGAPEEVKAAAVKGGFDIEGLEIIDPATYPGMDEMVEKMVVLRKGKMTAEQCREALSKGNYFGTMLVKMGYADAPIVAVPFTDPVFSSYSQVALLTFLLKLLSILELIYFVLAGI